MELFFPASPSSRCWPNLIAPYFLFAQSLRGQDRKRTRREVSGGQRVAWRTGEDLDAAAAAFDDYAGEYPSLADFAETLHRECGTAIPEALQYYIDWEAMGRDLKLNGDVFTVAFSYDGVHVFWNR